MGLAFWPRGGSAQVVRYLVPALERAGWPVRLHVGSLGPAGTPSHAGTFFSGIDLVPADFSPAMAAGAAGEDPLDQPVPLHPSFEDRPGAPDRIFTAVSPALQERQVASWEQVLGTDGEAGSPALLHLHHLTPLHDAAARCRPGLPVVTHLHGTEIKMVDGLRRRTALAERLGHDLAGMARLAEAGGLPDPTALDPTDQDLWRRTRWQAWRFGAHWDRNLTGAARRSDRLIVASPQDREEALRLFAVDPARVEAIPNGVDTDRFTARPLSGAPRLAQLRRWLVEDPQGWDETGAPGSVRYRDRDLAAFGDGTGPVLVFVGRFLGVKRVPLLLRAYRRARPRMHQPAPLLIWGGHPGEWEGEHPCTVARREGAEGVFFLGWRGHDELPVGLNCADVMVAPSVREAFGQVYVEAMASGLPVIATRSGGQVSFVNTDPARPNGWLVEPDDEAALADALVAAVDDEPGRQERAANAYAQIRAGYSWNGLAGRFAALYEDVLASPPSRP